MSWLTDPQIWIALITLTTLEIVRGIDNIIQIALLDIVFSLDSVITAIGMTSHLWAMASPSSWRC